MRWTYSCPHCEAMLNPDETVVLIGQRGNELLLMGLHPEPGNYRAYLPPGHKVEKDSRWDFLCPICHKSLRAAIEPELCALDMVTSGVRHRVYFSRIGGERATFVISAEGIESHGEHAERHSLDMLDLL